MIEEIARIQSAIPDKFVRRTVELIRASGAHDNDLRSGFFAILRAISVFYDIKLEHCIHA